MLLQTLPLVFALIGLALYAVLGGADFGAGWWQLTAGRGAAADRIRDHAHRAMGPVWEANHVWLIFVLTVVWTAYPAVFASIASTLSIPLFVAVVGILLRGGAYTVRAGTASGSERHAVDTVTSFSSILTPFALGTVIGGIASRRVPVGNAAGDLLSSWLNPTSVTIGALAVATSAYMAAVFLCADAVRAGDRSLEARFRRRALGAGTIAGGTALAGLVAVRFDAHPLYSRLVFGRGALALIASAAAGVTTLALVGRRRYEPARYTAALAVAAIIAGWALAQSPLLLPGLTVEAAAAPHDTLVALVVAIVAGGTILFPALAVLFRLVLRGRLGYGAPLERPAGGGRLEAVALPAPELLARLTVASLVAGVGFLSVAETAWAHAIGVISVLAFVAVGFRAVVSPEFLEQPGSPGRPSGGHPME